MKVRFVVTLAAICFALSAFADEAPLPHRLPKMPF
jgi:hypothetical protein